MMEINRCFQIIGMRFFEMMDKRCFQMIWMRYVEVTEMKCVEAAQLICV